MIRLRLSSCPGAERRHAQDPANRRDRARPDGLRAARCAVGAELLANRRSVLECLPPSLGFSRLDSGANSGLLRLNDHWQLGKGQVAQRDACWHDPNTFDCVGDSLNKHWRKGGSVRSSRSFSSLGTHVDDGRSCHSALGSLVPTLLASHSTNRHDAGCCRNGYGHLSDSISA